MWTYYDTQLKSSKVWIGPGSPFATIFLGACILAIPALVMSRMDGDTAGAIAQGSAADSTLALFILAIVSASLFAYLLAAIYSAMALCALRVNTCVPRAAWNPFFHRFRALVSYFRRLGGLLAATVLQIVCRLELTDALRSLKTPAQRLRLADCWSSGISPSVLYQ